MQVDTSVEAAGEKEKETDVSKASGKKYNAPVDGQSGDLIIEGTAYLRLLLVLMNLDAGKVEEVSLHCPIVSSHELTRSGRQVQ